MTIGSRVQRAIFGRLHCCLDCVGVDGVEHFSKAAAECYLEEVEIKDALALLLGKRYFITCCTHLGTLQHAILGSIMCLCALESDKELRI